MGRHTTAMRRAYGLCMGCGKESVKDCTYCRLCRIKRNERRQQKRFDAQIEREEYLRGDRRLVNTQDVAKLLGIKVGSVHARVTRGELVPVIRGQGRWGFSWFLKSALG